MADIITSPQITKLITEFSNMLAVPREVASRLIMGAINNGQLVFAVPFNTDEMDLEVKTGAGGSTAIGQPSVSSLQTIINQKDNTSRSYTNAAEVTALTYTVTVGKTLFITDIFAANGEIAINEQLLQFHVYDGATMIYSGIVAGPVSPPSVLRTGGNGVHQFKTPIKVAASQAVTIKIVNGNSVATLVLFVGFNGFEE